MAKKKNKQNVALVRGSHCGQMLPSSKSHKGRYVLSSIGGITQHFHVFGSHVGWIGGAIFVTAGVYQLTSFKDVCLRHCRSPMSLLAYYTSFRGPAIDMRVGIHHGIYCVGCCWGLMLILVAVGVMNILAMAVLTIIIFAEKALRHGMLITRLTGVSFLRRRNHCGDLSQAFPRSERMLPAVSSDRGCKIGLERS